MADVAMSNLEDFPVLPSGLAEVNKMIREHSELFSDSQCKVCSAVLISESQKLTHYQSKKHANKVRRYLCIQNEKEKEPTLKKPKPSDDDITGSGIQAETDKYKVCHVCNMTFSSPVVAESHYQGKVHSKNLRLKTVGPQHVQNPVFQTAEQPVGPAKKKEEPAPAKKESVEGGGGGGEADKFCSVCQASFNNPLMAAQHYAGKKHKKHMTKMKLMETYGPSSAPQGIVKGYPCAVCTIELNSVEQYQAHISGAKHKNQIRKNNMPPAEEIVPFLSGGDDACGDPPFTGGEEEKEEDASTTEVTGGRGGGGGGAEEEEESQLDDEGGENQYPAGDAPYTAEGINQYSEEYLYT